MKKQVLSLTCLADSYNCNVKVNIWTMTSKQIAVVLYTLQIVKCHIHKPVIVELGNNIAKYKTDNNKKKEVFQEQVSVCDTSKISILNYTQFPDRRNIASSLFSKLKFRNCSKPSLQKSSHHLLLRNQRQLGSKKKKNIRQIFKTRILNRTLANVQKRSSREHIKYAGEPNRRRRNISDARRKEASIRMQKLHTATNSTEQTLKSENQLENLQDNEVSRHSSNGEERRFNPLWGYPGQDDYRGKFLIV